MPVILAGNTSGATTLQATDAVTATITLPSATDTLVGKTTPSFTTTIGVGNATPSASGAGITFPATQSASTDANTLDDYEEGTWTPVLGGSGGTSGQTYNFREGKYTKAGNAVTCTCIIQMLVKGTITGNLQLQGIPFVMLGYSGAALGYHFRWTATAGKTISIAGNTGESVYTFWQAGVAGDDSSVLTTTAITDLSQIVLSFSYLAST